MTEIQWKSQYYKDKFSKKEIKEEEKYNNKKRFYKSKAKKNKRKEIDITENVIHIFTDGSAKRNPGPCGSACILLYNKHRKNISKYLGFGTNNVAELTAIKLALKAIKKDYKHLPIIIYTDSMYCIGVLRMNWSAKKNHKLIQEIKDMIKSFRKIEFQKVKAHYGVKYNEEVDKMAKKTCGVL